MNDDTTPAPEAGEATTPPVTAPPQQPGAHEVAVSSDGQLSMSPAKPAPEQPLTPETVTTTTPASEPTTVTDLKPAEPPAVPLNEQPSQPTISAIGVPLVQSNVITPESNPAPVVKGTDNTPATPMIFSHNSMHGGGGKSHRVIWASLTFILLAGLAVGGYIYFWTIPSGNTSTYLSAVKPAYNDQSSKMGIVYDTLSRPIFAADSSSTPESDAKDIGFIKTTISVATNSNTKLKALDNFKILPLTTWQHSVSDTEKKHEAMQKYLKDCDTFLKDYQAMANYLEKFESIISTNQLGAALNSLDQVEAAKTLTELLPKIQATLAVTTPLVNSLKQLNPPPDLKQFNDNIVNSLTGINKALADINSAVVVKSQTKLGLAAIDLQQQIANLKSLQNTNIDLQKNSDISSQITKLKAEKPLN